MSDPHLKFFKMVSCNYFTGHKYVTVSLCNIVMRLSVCFLCYNLCDHRVSKRQTTYRPITFELKRSNESALAAPLETTKTDNSSLNISRQMKQTGRKRNQQVKARDENLGASGAVVEHLPLGGTEVDISSFSCAVGTSTSVNFVNRSITASEKPMGLLNDGQQCDVIDNSRAHVFRADQRKILQEKQSVSYSVSEKSVASRDASGKIICNEADSNSTVKHRRELSGLIKSVFNKSLSEHDTRSVQEANIDVQAQDNVVTSDHRIMTRSSSGKTLPSTGNALKQSESNKSNGKQFKTSCRSHVAGGTEDKRGSVYRQSDKQQDAKKLTLKMVSSVNRETDSVLDYAEKGSLLFVKGT